MPMKPVNYAKVTRDELYTLVTACATEKEATDLVRKLVYTAHGEGGVLPVPEIRKRVLSNIGYLTGYMDDETGMRVLRLFKTEHPIFGMKRPTAQEALDAGIAYGTAWLKKRALEEQSD